VTGGQAASSKTSLNLDEIRAYKERIAQQLGRPVGKEAGSRSDKKKASSSEGHQKVAGNQDQLLAA
jgi:hypothetical protein